MLWFYVGDNAYVAKQNAISRSKGGAARRHQRGASQVATPSRFTQNTSASMMPRVLI